MTAVVSFSCAKCVINFASNNFNMFSIAFIHSSYIDRMYLSDLSTIPVFNLPNWGSRHKQPNHPEVGSRLAKMASVEYTDYSAELESHVKPLVDRYPMLFAANGIEIDLELLIWAAKLVYSRNWSK